MQLHKRFSVDQIIKVLEQYTQGGLSATEARELLGLKKTQFFAWIKQYRQDPSCFTSQYQRATPKQIGQSAEDKIKQVLFEDHQLVANPDLPITTHNYSAVRDRLNEQGVMVSLPTIIARAKAYGYYQPRKKKQRSHHRQVLTTAVGTLIQHDSSLHLWSPYAAKKWSLITSLDDYSRLLLFADLVETETSWAHIQASSSVTLRYGVPFQWYTDQLRTFRFVAHGTSFWTEQRLVTDDVNPQWKACIQASGSQVIYALSPQAKGKIERPYRWLQDRIVRTCVREKLRHIDEVRQVLQQEVSRYNTKQVHSTTQEIPLIRFTKVRQAGNSLFTSFKIPAPYQYAKDIFYLRQTRTTNTYRKVSLDGVEIQLPQVPKCEEVEIHLIPNQYQQTIEVRVWWKEQLVSRSTHPRSTFPKVRF